MVGNHGQRWRRAASFTHGHTYPRQCQAPIASGHAAKGCHGTPSCAAIRHKISTIGAVGIATKRNGQNAVKQGKSEATQQTHGRIRNLKFFLDGLNQNAHDLPVDETHGVDKQKHQQGVVASKSVGRRFQNGFLHSGRSMSFKAVQVCAEDQTLASGLESKFGNCPNP